MNKRQIMLAVNGRDHEVWVQPSQTLLDVLHDELGLSDVRYGCGEGLCGTCTVLLDGEPVCACLVPAAQAEGRVVVTVEGLEFGAVQRAFIDAGAVQCGFCTPGLIVAVHDLINETAALDDQDIREALAGNLCRCTGYEKIIEAVRLAMERR